MNFIKKLFKRKQKAITKKEEKKENECWYNDMHEKGEAIRGATSFGIGGSGNSFHRGGYSYRLDRFEIAEGVLGNFQHSVLDNEVFHPIGVLVKSRIYDQKLLVFFDLFHITKALREPR